MEDRGNFAEMFKYLRMRDGLSQSQLAKKLHCSPALIGMYEQGRRMPSFEMQQNIADFFNVSIDLLRGITEEILDRETEEMVRLFHNSSPEMRKAAMAVLKSGQQQTEPLE